MAKMSKQILLILLTAFITGACSYTPPPPPSCHGTWTSLNSDFEFTPEPVFKPFQREDNEREIR